MSDTTTWRDYLALTKPGVVMLLMVVSLLKAFRDEPINPTVRDREPKAPSEPYGDVEHPRGAD